MKSYLNWLRKILWWVGRIEIIVANCILIGIVVMILTQVFLNAGLGKPITWEQEAGAYALVWLTFIGASIGLKQMRHVTIVSFVGYLPRTLQRVIYTLVFAVILWTLFVLMYMLFPIMEIESRSTTVALPIDLPRSFFFSVPLFISCGLMAISTITLMLETFLSIWDKSDALLSGKPTAIME